MSIPPGYFVITAVSRRVINQFMAFRALDYVLLLLAVIPNSLGCPPHEERYTSEQSKVQDICANFQVDLPLSQILFRGSLNRESCILQMSGAWPFSALSPKRPRPRPTIILLLLLKASKESTRYQFSLWCHYRSFLLRVFAASL